MHRFKSIRTAAIFSLALIAMACKKDDDSNPDPDPIILEVKTVNSLPSPENADEPVYYSLETGKEIPASQANTSNWDVAFVRTTIMLNGGSSGPGKGTAQMWTGIFEELKEAPATGYRADNAPESYAVPTGSGNGWYQYNPGLNTITPIAGRVIVLTTASGKFAKLEMLNYYKGAPAVPTSTDVARHYTFRYVYQPDGTKKLE
jgi:hypothetical protein